MKTPITDELDEVSCVMSDEETVKAYKKLCRKLEAQAQRWRTVAEGLYKNSPSGYSCECFHHAKGDYHNSGEPCKPYDRWAAALAAFEQAKRDLQ